MTPVRTSQVILVVACLSLSLALFGFPLTRGSVSANKTDVHTLHVLSCVRAAHLSSTPQAPAKRELSAEDRIAVNMGGEAPAEEASFVQATGHRPQPPPQTSAWHGMVLHVRVCHSLHCMTSHSYWHQYLDTYDAVVRSLRAWNFGAEVRKGLRQT